MLLPIEETRLPFDLSPEYHNLSLSDIFFRVDKDYVVKVSDATLSMDIYELDYWRPGEKLKFQPVKWMAPESLLTRITTSKSDVVSLY